VSRWSNAAFDTSVTVIRMLRDPRGRLFLTSGTILFVELLLIRWIPANVAYVGFFNNFLLLSSFLGIGIGILLGRRVDARAAAWFAPCAFAIVVFVSLAQVNIRNEPGDVWFATGEGRRLDINFIVLPSLLILTTIAMAFLAIPLGPLFRTMPPLRAYAFDISGSMAGIALFAGVSLAGLPPSIWFAIAGLLVALLTFGRAGRWQRAVGMAALVGAAMVSFGIETVGGDVYSPYYRLDVVRTPRTDVIFVNGLAFQAMFPAAAPKEAYYDQVYRWFPDRTFAKALIIGAGSGTDVSVALAHGTRAVDAVEIDPGIQAIGRAQHPDHPYSDPRVSAIIADGRAFLRNSTERYDLIVFAVTDSLTLVSSTSNLRLESFLFTEESFASARDHLTPDGVFVMYNYYRQGWVVGRLAKMALDQFGASPLVMALPYQAEIGEGLNLDNVRTFILVGNGKENHTVDSIRAKFAENGSFWVNERPQFNGVNSFRADMPFIPGAGQWHKIAPAKVDTAAVALTPTDNWPFLYLKDKAIPRHPSLDGILVIAAVSLVILLAFAPVRRIRPNGQMFFLGAGFMLLETKGVVHMALLFGSTWVVNSFVFAAILVMILCSNLYVLALRPRKLWPYYLLLAAALLVNVFVPMRYFLSLSGTLRPVVSCAVIFVPIFFAGVIFATSFRDSTQPDIDMGSNIAGIILGGLSEYFSLMLGFNYLLGIAIAFYLLSMVLRRRMPLAPAPPVVS